MTTPLAAGPTFIRRLTQRGGVTISVISLTILSACHSARPLSPLAPNYPAILSNAGVAGSSTIRVHVDRNGIATAELPTTSSAQDGLFGAAAKRALTEASWSPAKKFGLRRAQDVRYRVDFVLLRDTVPGNSHERVIDGNDRLAVDCPTPRSNHHLVVCARPGRTPVKGVSPAR